MNRSQNYHIHQFHLHSVGLAEIPLPSSQPSTSVASWTNHQTSSQQTVRKLLKAKCAFWERYFYNPFPVVNTKEEGNRDLQQHLLLQELTTWQALLPLPTARRTLQFTPLQKEPGPITMHSQVTEVGMDLAGTASHY